MISILKAFISILTSIACLFSFCFVGNFAGPYSPKRPDECQLNFAAISDIHMMESNSRRYLLELGLCDMENADTPLDALVMAGDNTQRARSDHYKQLETAFSHFTPAKNIVMAMGNHDGWNNEIDEENRFPESERLFIEYNKKIANREIDKTYFSTVINGYTFIALGTETDYEDYACISDEQLDWLRSEMEKASHSGLPIFVISHWSINGTHGLPNTWEGVPADKVVPGLDPTTGGFGEQSDEIEAILNSYDNVFLISGHIHNGISNRVEDTRYGFSTVETVGKIHSINLPTYGNTAVRGRAIAAGMGLQIEVYENEVLIRARSFTGGVWYTATEFTVDLV